MAGLAAEHGEEKTMMIEVSRRKACVRVSLRKYLKAHRTATSMAAKREMAIDRHWPEGNGECRPGGRTKGFEGLRNCPGDLFARKRNTKLHASCDSHGRPVVTIASIARPPLRGGADQRPAPGLRLGFFLLVLACVAAMLALPRGDPSDQFELSPEFVFAGRPIAPVMPLIRIAHEPDEARRFRVCPSERFHAMRAERLAAHQDIELAAMLAAAGAASQYQVIPVIDAGCDLAPFYSAVACQWSRIGKPTGTGRGWIRSGETCGSVFISETSEKSRAMPRPQSAGAGSGKTIGQAGVGQRRACIVCGPGGPAFRDIAEFPQLRQRRDLPMAGLQHLPDAVVACEEMRAGHQQPVQRGESLVAGAFDESAHQHDVPLQRQVLAVLDRGGRDDFGQFCCTNRSSSAVSLSPDRLILRPL
ncbi:hypothetical protein JMM51_19850 [Rhodovulum sulfidophilum]|nr:hypothetical protein [Rhodovulum sulfidophilum]